MNPIFDSLNPEQKEAVFHTEGPVLILAGAGSGKTRVITHRIAYLLQEKQVKPWNILAITFTNKAAGEMRERVNSLIGAHAEEVWVSTFHSMCARILRRYLDRLLLNTADYPGCAERYLTSFTIYDTDDQKTLMKQICKDLQIDSKEYPPKSLLNAISAAKNQLRTPAAVAEEADSYRERLVADVYAAYQQRLQKNNALDFDDLLMKTVELLRCDREVLEGYRARFRYIMVDEYQDTNTAQFALVELLAGGHRNLCVVGDDDQSIYRFRGANIRNILDFEKVFSDAFVVRLEQNYRSTQHVLDAANAVIGHNENRKKKALWTDRGEGQPLRYRGFSTAPEEAAFVAQDVDRQLRNTPGLHYRDIAVLYRTNAQSRLLEEQLLYHAVPYDIVGGTNFYERREIRDILAYLQTIENGQDDLALRRIINVPRRGIGKTSIDRLSDYAASRGISLFAALFEAEAAGLGAAALKKLRPFTELIDELRRFAKENSLEDLVKQILETTGYEEDLRNSGEEDAEERLQNIDELITKVVTYEQRAKEEDRQDAAALEGVPESSTPRTALAGFLQEVSLLADIDNVDEEEETDKVLLMTLHSAKGLEFPVVYMVGLEEGLFPGQSAVDSYDDEEVEEERRLAYVGITRAKDLLTITSAASRMLRGEMFYKPISRFVREIPEELWDEAPPKEMERGSYDRYEEPAFFNSYGRRRFDDAPPWETGGYDAPRYAAGGRPNRLKATYVKPHTAEEKKPFIAQSLSQMKKGLPDGAGEKPDYAVGDRVRHIKHGDGTVLAMEETPRDTKVTVLFDEAGQKIMYAAFARLQKL